MSFLYLANTGHRILSVPVMIIICGAIAVLLPLILRNGRRLFLWCSGIGFVVPWLAGIAVKLWLQSRGWPTHSYSDYFSIGWLLASVAFAFPLMIFGLFAQRVLARKPCCGLNTQRARNCMIAGVLLGTAAGMTLAFIDFFWDFQFPWMLWFVAPLLWINYIDVTAVGALAGWVVGRLIQDREIASRHWSGDAEERTRTHHEKTGTPVP